MIPKGRRDVIYTLTILPDYSPVRGNALASGDDAVDRRVENTILRRLDRGDVWAWCTVKVTARWGGFSGTDSLGGCNYRNEAEFRLPGGYYHDMCAAALADLERQLVSAQDYF